MRTAIQSIKGTRDFYPEDMALRSWLHDMVRRVSESFGYQEYDAPLIESIELYAAKSGEELVKEQSFVFPDRGGDLGSADFSPKNELPLPAHVQRLPAKVGEDGLGHMTTEPCRILLLWPKHPALQPFDLETNRLLLDQARRLDEIASAGLSVAGGCQINAPGRGGRVALLTFLALALGVGALFLAARAGTPPPLARQLLGGNPRALARSISLVEEERPEGRAVLKAIYPRTGRALVLGITGPPGAGKSSLVSRLVAAWRARGEKVGIVAVDPSSAFSGGAILGDRIRMQEHALDPGVFIRSMATRGHFGGVSRACRDVVDLMDASGRGIVLIETVGVGQDEVEVVEIADLVLVVLPPGQGDDIQAIKAGILEIADVFVINKADREGADRLESELQAMLTLSGDARTAATPAARMTTLSSMLSSLLPATPPPAAMFEILMLKPQTPRSTSTILPAASIATP